MIDGSQLKKLREQRKMTQQELADKMGLTVQAVSQWENGKTQPDISRVTELGAHLGISLDALMNPDVRPPSWQFTEKVFSPEHIFTRMKTTAEAESLPLMKQALYFAREKHEGQVRDAARGSTETVPYVQHPFKMAAVAHAMGVREDNVLATILLHDVCEECDVAVQDLPFPAEVQDAVRLLTKDKEAFSENPDVAAEEYYGAIRTNGTAMLVKCFDRYDNLSTASACFSSDRLRRYVVETEQYILPLLEVLDRDYIQYADQVFVLKFQLLALIEAIKADSSSSGYRRIEQPEQAACYEMEC